MQRPTQGTTYVSSSTAIKLHNNDNNKKKKLVGKQTTTEIITVFVLVHLMFCCGASVNALSTPELLADIVEQSQLVDAACLSRLKDAFSSLSLLPPALALQLLQAVLVR